MEQKLVVLTEEALSRIDEKLDLLLKIQNNKNTIYDTWLTKCKVLELLNISNSTLQMYRNKGQIKFSQIGRKIMYSQKDVEDFLTKNKV